ncbi:MAG: universal stress protein, partial [candidate division KSB1 bacterium]|nr:universal stress protein [candidate division KSB1 bacterium]
MNVEESEGSPIVHSQSRYDEPIFRKAVVAAAFSPRLTAVLNEAHRILCAFGAEAVLVHVGDAGRQSEEKLRKIAASTKIWELQPSVMLREGNPGDELAAAAAELGADLIIAGALAKEGLFKYYLGSVARTLAREAPCSVFLLTEPTVNGHTFQRIH